MRISRILLLCFFMVFAFADVHSQNAQLEYIAHGTFSITSDEGTKLMIDPYHGYRQMGYTFPESITADLVLITHPHYDHDGSVYFSQNTPIFREAGTYQFKDIKFIGISSKHAHAEQIGKSGNPNYNTIWKVQVGAVKIAHLGDNEVPTAEEIALLADVDFIIGPPQEAYYRLFPNKTYIPNHYLLPEITEHKNWMKPVAGWLSTQQNVEHLTTNVLPLTSIKRNSGILVFTPSKTVKEWSESYYKALEYIKQGQAAFKKTSETKDAILFMQKAIEAAPYVADGYLGKATFLEKENKGEAVIRELELAFARVPDLDWGVAVRMRKMLADAYAGINQESLAYNNYLWVVRNSRIANSNAVKAAMNFIETHKK